MFFIGMNKNLKRIVDYDDEDDQSDVQEIQEEEYDPEDDTLVDINLYRRS